MGNIADERRRSSPARDQATDGSRHSRTAAGAGSGGAFVGTDQYSALDGIRGPEQRARDPRRETAAAARRIFGLRQPASAAGMVRIEEAWQHWVHPLQYLS